MRVISERSAAGFTGLLMTGTSISSAAARTSLERSAVTRIAAVSAPKAALQLADRVEPVLAVEMIVGKHDIGRRQGGAMRLDRARAGERPHTAAPALEQQAHAVEDARVVVDAEHGQTVERNAGAHFRLRLDHLRRLGRVGHRQDQREARALALVGGRCGFPASARARSCRRSTGRARGRALRARLRRAA